MQRRLISTRLWRCPKDEAFSVIIHCSGGGGWGVKLSQVTTPAEQTLQPESLLCNWNQQLSGDTIRGCVLMLPVSLNSNFLFSIMGGKTGGGAASIACGSILT